MKPAQLLSSRVLSRREMLLCSGMLLLTGCTTPAVRTQSPEDTSTLESQVRLIGDVAAPYGTNYIKIESVALVTGLANTGSDAGPSPMRSSILADMQTRGVINPNKILANPSNSVVWVRGYLPPGVQKGDHFDIEVRVPGESETTSLRGGWLMECRLREMAVLGNQLRDGHLLGIAQGPVLVDPTASEKNDKELLCQGNVLGGGVALKPRSLGLALKNEEKSVRTSSQIGSMINRRFHTFNNGLKKGVATPHTDELVELTLHPKYKDNIPRYIRVCRAIALHETSSQQLARIELLERQLLDPVTTATAAIRLEAIGKTAQNVLHKGLASKDREVRFYSAEALAYLEDASSGPELARAAREEPAFRAFALTALSTIEDLSAYDLLRDLLDVTSAETRYGAFRALRAQNDRDPLVRGEMLGDQFHYHVIKTAGPPMAHVTKKTRPEVVLFGDDQRLLTPVVVDAGTAIVINAASPEQVTLSKFAVGQADQKRVVSSKLDDIIRAIVELGGTYPDVVQALQEAKAAKALSGRFEVDAIPQGGRSYDRVPEEGEVQASGESFEVTTPLPGLYSDGAGKSKKDRKPSKRERAAAEAKKASENSGDASNDSTTDSSE